MLAVTIADAMAQLSRLRTFEVVLVQLVEPIRLNAASYSRDFL